MRTFLKSTGAATISAVIAMLCVVSCAEPNYNQQIETCEKIFLSDIEAIEKDKSLSEEEKSNREEDLFEELQDDVEKIARRALRKHTDDKTAVDMVCALSEFNILDDEELVELIQTLDPNVQNAPEIIRFRANMEKKSQTATGEKFKDFSVKQPDGKVLKLSDFAGKGKLCLVDFWASWCGPCKGEIPNLREVYDKYADDGIVMVSVAVWDTPKSSLDTAAAYGVCWNQIVNAQNVPTDLYGIEAIPHIMLIGPDGTILKRDLRGSEIAKAVKQYL